MRTEQEPRVVFVEGAPGPALLMARAYAASAAALFFRTPLVVGVALMPVVAAAPPLRAYLTGELSLGEMLPFIALGVSLSGLALIGLALAWSGITAVRRALRPSLAWVATRDWSTAVVWVEEGRAGGRLYARFWGSFPGGIGSASAGEFLRHVDANGITVGAHARTKSLQARYEREGFVATDEKDVLGRRLLLRPPQ